jgi:hypothetical protein
MLLVMKFIGVTLSCMQCFMKSADFSLVVSILGAPVRKTKKSHSADSAVGCHGNTEMVDPYVTEVVVEVLSMRTQLHALQQSLPVCALRIRRVFHVASYQ